MTLTPERIASPCASVCALDNDDICIGCFRTGMEISYWGRFTPDQQRDVVIRCAQRMRGEPAACLVTGS